MDQSAELRLLNIDIVLYDDIEDIPVTNYDTVSNNVTDDDDDEGGKIQDGDDSLTADRAVNVEVAELKLKDWHWRELAQSNQQLVPCAW